MSQKSKLLQAFDEHARWYKKKFNKYKWVHLVIAAAWFILTALLDIKLGDTVAITFAVAFFVVYSAYNVIMTNYKVENVPEEDFYPDK